MDRAKLMPLFQKEEEDAYDQIITRMHQLFENASFQHKNQTNLERNRIRGKMRMQASGRESNVPFYTISFTHKSMDH